MTAATSSGTPGRRGGCATPGPRRSRRPCRPPRPVGVVERGVDPAGADAGDADAVRAHRDRERPGQRDEAALGGGVGEAPAATPEGGGGSGEHHAAVRRVLEVRSRRLGRQEGRPEVERHRPIPFGHTEICQFGLDEKPCAEDDGIQAAVRLHRVGDRLGGSVGRGQVDTARRPRTGVGVQGLDDLGGARRVDVGHVHVGPRRAQPGRGGGPDAARATGYQHRCHHNSNL